MSFNIAKTTRVRTVNVEATVDGQVYTLYTCPANCRAMMSLLFFANVGGNVTVNVEWERADGTHAHIVGGKNMTTGEFVQFSNGYLVFEAGDYMTVTADGSTPHVDFLATVEEIFLPVGG